jgi:D-glycero-D-manno-heptose 1,7-bisphosphate phosphatase
VKNGKSFAPRTLNDFKFYPYTINNIKKLKKNNFMIFVITNQPDIGNKLLNKNTLNQMHNKIKKFTLIDGISACLHSQKNKCKCRKPKPKMINDIVNKYNINILRSFMVGDRASDILAGKSAGCKTIFIDRNYVEIKPNVQDFTVKSMNQAVITILNNS